MNDPVILLQTKLFQPEPQADMIARPHLLERLNRNPQRKATLISAPVGYGKTTLVAAWLQDRHDRVAWVSLGEHENDLHLFLRYLLAAVTHVHTQSLERTSALLDSAQLPPADFLAASLINDLSELSAGLDQLSGNPRLYIVLDDFHHIADRQVHQLLRTLLEHLPPLIHLVLISRTDPLQLPINRLRANRQLVEIRQSDLRFDRRETDEFLRNSLGYTLDDALVVDLDGTLEGWPVGLRLASLSLRSEQDPASMVQSLRDHHGFATAYLVDEVVNRQPQAVQDFLLRTAVLDQFCAPLCAAVAGHGGAAYGSVSMLAQIEQAGLFVVTLDSAHEWYRYHPLFRDLLLDRLRQTQPDEAIRALHRRASAWFAQNRLIEEAIHHSLAADDVDNAVALVEQNSQDLLNGMERFTLKRWLANLPQEVLWQRPRLLVAQAWLLYRQGRWAELDAVLDRAETALDAAGVDLWSPSTQNSIAGQINALRSSTAFGSADYARCYALSDLALAQAPDDASASGLALMFGVNAQQMRGDREGAHRRIATALDSPQPAGPARIQALIGLSFLHWTAGELPQMEVVTQRFRGLAQDLAHANAIVASHWVSGLLHFEWDELAAAKRYFQRAGDLRFASNYIASFSSLYGYAKACLISGDAATARKALDVLQREAAQMNSGLLPLLAAYRADFDWRTGDVDRARRWARSDAYTAPVETPSLFDYPSLIRARILVSSPAGSSLAGEASSADQTELRRVADQLRSALAQADADHFTQRAIRVGAHLALVQYRLDETAEAVALAMRTLRMAAPGGFIRSFVDCGPTFAALLDELPAHAGAGRTSDDSLNGAELPSADYMARLRGAFSRDWGAASHRQAPAKANGDVYALLTKREEEVLRLMSAGLTNQEIAAKLVISLYTVKRHATNIYNKLAVSNRREAIRKAGGSPTSAG